MNITLKILFIIHFLFSFEANQSKKTETFKTDQIIESDFLSSGLYLINDSLGIKRAVRGTNNFFLINPKPIISIRNVNKVKLIFEKNKVYGKTKKRYGLSFQLDQIGKKELENASRDALKNHQKMGLIIQDELVTTPYVSSEITNGLFFIEMSISKEDLKELEKRIKAELKTHK